MTNVPSEAADTQAGLTHTVERYLEAIFYIDAEGESVRASRLAEWLGVSQPTAGATLRRMINDDLVEISAAKVVSLTPRGRSLAAAIVRRHRVAERWLTDVLGFDWTSADDEASRLAHALSDAVTDRLFESAGRPYTCPHGNPIPGVDAPPRPERALGTLDEGERSKVRRISEVAEHEAPDLLRFLGEHGFHVGVEVEAVSVSRGAGTLTVRVGDQEVSLSLEVANKVWIDA
ncbi:MAG: metal-dependent transcriptional regulator [Dehalococcoidia bacterium]